MIRSAAALWAAGVPLDQGLSDVEQSAVLPILNSYQMIQKCRALGIKLSPHDVTPDQIDDWYTIQSKIDEVESKKTNKGKGHGR
jgi:hypothetical protein